jgi:hypothetical protein
MYSFLTERTETPIVWWTSKFIKKKEKGLKVVMFLFKSCCYFKMYYPVIVCYVLRV